MGFLRKIVLDSFNSSSEYNCGCCLCGCVVGCNLLVVSLMSFGGLCIYKLLWLHLLYILCIFFEGLFWCFCLFVFRMEYLGNDLHCGNEDMFLEVTPSVRCDDFLGVSLYRLCNCKLGLIRIRSFLFVVAALFVFEYCV